MNSLFWDTFFLRKDISKSTPKMVALFLTKKKTKKNVHADRVLNFVTTKSFPANDRSSISNVSPLLSALFSLKSLTKSPTKSLSTFSLKSPLLSFSEASSLSKFRKTFFLRWRCFSGVHFELPPSKLLWTWRSLLYPRSWHFVLERFAAVFLLETEYSWVPEEFKDALRWCPSEPYLPCCSPLRLHDVLAIGMLYSKPNIKYIRIIDFECSKDRVWTSPQVVLFVHSNICVENLKNRQATYIYP